MSQSVQLQAKEDLAQLGIRKGSRFLPIVSIIIAAALSFLFLTESAPLRDRMRDACIGAEGRVLAYNWGTASPPLTQKHLAKLKRTATIISSYVTFSLSRSADRRPPTQEAIDSLPAETRRVLKEIDQLGEKVVAQKSSLSKLEKALKAQFEKSNAGGGDFAKFLAFFSDDTRSPAPMSEAERQRLISLPDDTRSAFLKIAEAQRQLTADTKRLRGMVAATKGVADHKRDMLERLIEAGANGRKFAAMCMRPDRQMSVADRKLQITDDFDRSQFDPRNKSFKDLSAYNKAQVYFLLVGDTVDPQNKDKLHPQKRKDDAFDKEWDKAVGAGQEKEDAKADWGKAFKLVSPFAADITRVAIKDTYYDFRHRLLELIIAIVIIGFISFIPGLFGMVYRRSFWSYFLVPFGVLLLITLWIRFGGEKTAGSVLILLLAQLFLLLLVLRLRRYSNIDSLLSSSWYNRILGGLLALVAVDYVLASIDYTTPLNIFWAWNYWPLGRIGRIIFVVLILPAIYALFKRSRAWAGTGPKNIVVCLDGTTNTPDQMEGGRLAQTNVFKLFKMLKSDAPTAEATSTNYNASISKRYGNKQLGLYYSGVGNRFEYNPIVQMLGGATGLGAADVVDRAYLDVMRVYRPGDKVFIVGFSRGAAIARLLARALDQRGSPRTVWTLRLLGRYWTIWTSRRDKSKDLEIPVTVLGCWDTVGAFGIAKNIAGIDFQKMDLFKDLTVPDNVEQAYHMVALDEEREEFQPTLMEPDPLNPARIIEVWFSGDHANIGGGWATTKLSDLTLDFLLTKISSGYAHEPGMQVGDESWGIYLDAVKAGVETTAGGDDAPFAVEPDPLGQLRRWDSALYEYMPRQLPNHAVISDTVFARMTNAQPLYAPQSLFDLHDNLTKKRESVVTAVDRLKTTASLNEEEHARILAFKERLHITRWPLYFEALSTGPDASWKEPSKELSNKPKPASEETTA